MSASPHKDRSTSLVCVCVSVGGACEEEALSDNFINPQSSL